MTSTSRDFRTPESLCPHCGYKVDACSVPFSLDSPSPGDLSVCINCGGLLEFCSDLTMQALEQDKVFEVILSDPQAYAQLMKVRGAVLAAKKERDDRNG